ncbi:MAG: DinB family protein [Calditrichaeota bacterium]|nr:DinB family protein [Calditrichota bacterium]MCB9369383.1 DinB family protein [Calditrichota bacterium]
MQMMKMMIQPRIDYFKMIHGVTKRILDQMPADKMDFKPTPEVRSWSETVQHMYGSHEALMKMTRDGKFVEEASAKNLSKAELAAFVDEKFAAAMKVWDEIKDEDLNKKVEAWGETMDSYLFPFFAVDEHWHHRGALTIYLRMNGITPVMIYDYQH